MFSKFKAALSSVILYKDQDSAMTAEDVLYEGQTMSGLTFSASNLLECVLRQGKFPPSIFYE